LKLELKVSPSRGNKKMRAQALYRNKTARPKSKPERESRRLELFFQPFIPRQSENRAVAKEATSGMAMLAETKNAEEVASKRLANRLYRREKPSSLQRE